MRKKSCRLDECLNKNEFPEEEFRTIGPITRKQFQDLYSFCDPVPEKNTMRKVSRRDLITFLGKLRQVLSDGLMKVILNYSTLQCVSMAISKVRQSLIQRFVPENIGFTKITREHFIDQHIFQRS